MVLIGIDPHKATHTAVAVDETENSLGELTVKADRTQIERLLKWAIDWLLGRRPTNLSRSAKFPPVRIRR